MASSKDEAMGQKTPGAAVPCRGQPTEPSGAGSRPFQSPVAPATANPLLPVGESQGLSSQLDTGSSVLRLAVIDIVSGIHPHGTTSHQDPPQLDLDWSGSRLSFPLSGPLSTRALTWELIPLPSIGYVIG